MDHYTLSYVNTAADTVNYDKEFDTIIKLIAFVNDNHKNVTSYQIIVSRKE